MSAESDLFSALTARPALTALVGSRIYPDIIPEGAALPAVVYQRSSTSPVTTIGSVRVAEDVRFGISAWAISRADADTVADEVAAAIAASSNQVVDRTHGYDTEVWLYAATVEVDWWHSIT